MSDNFRRQYEILMTKAGSDLAAAKHLLLVQDEELDLEVIFFHLQQAAEKYLKTLLSFHGEHFEKVHDLGRLMEMCIQKQIDLPEYVSVLVELNPYAVEGRYGLIVDDMHDAAMFCDLIGEFKLYCRRVVAQGDAVRSEVKP